MSHLQRSQVTTWLESQRSSALTYLSEIVQTDSFTKNISGVAALQRTCASKFETLGLAVEFHALADRGPILTADTVATQRGTSPLLLVGHVDTVHSSATVPHTVHQQDDQMFGPGIYDMKAGILMIQLALESLASMQILDQMPIRVILNSAEEDSTEESRAFMNDIANSAQCGLVFEFGRDGGNIITSRKGLVEARIQVQGQSGHAGNQDSSEGNAIEALASIIVQLQSVRDQTCQTSINFGKIEGGASPSVISDFAQVRLEVRSATKMGLLEALNSLKNVTSQVPKTSVKVFVDKQIPPLEDSPESHRLARAYQRAGTEAGLSLSLLPRQGGTSDANQLGTNGLPIIDGLGALGGGAHTKEEYILASSIVPKTANLIFFLLDQWNQ